MTIDALGAIHDHPVVGQPGVQIGVHLVLQLDFADLRNEPARRNPLCVDIGLNGNKVRGSAERTEQVDTERREILAFSNRGDA